jgi:hypothetical protein
MSADLADWDRTLLNLPIGQSGHVLSRNYRDDWRRFYLGEGRPLPFLKAPGGAVLRLAPK